MQWYGLLKTIHVTSVGLSFSLFVLRGIWMMLDSQWLQWKPVRIVPHIVDSILLASAIGLTIVLHQYPLVQAWLTAKVIGLVIYIVLGTIALKRGRSKKIRTVAWLAALLVFAYIVSVAIAHHPYGVFYSGNNNAVIPAQTGIHLHEDGFPLARE